MPESRGQRPPDEYGESTRPMTRGLHWPWLVLALVAGVLAQVNRFIGELVTLLAATFVLWVLIFFGFTPHGIVLQRRGLRGALWDSVRLVQRNLPQTAGLYAALMIISVGLGLVWRLPSAETWWMAIGLGAHALVATALLAATVVAGHPMAGNERGGRGRPSRRSRPARPARPGRRTRRRPRCGRRSSPAGRRGRGRRAIRPWARRKPRPAAGRPSPSRRRRGRRRSGRGPAGRWRARRGAASCPPACRKPWRPQGRSRARENLTLGPTCSGSSDRRRLPAASR